jgi:CPA1 family monovalent cation:H+ antiporter
MSTHSVVAGLVTLTALSSYINHRWIKLPKSIGLTLITFFISILILIVAHMGVDVTNQARTFLNNLEFNDTFLNGMLGFLIFAVSLHVNTIELAKQKWVILLLATLSVLLSTVAIGFATWFLAKSVGYELSLAYCLVFGALISPTDPIAVLGLMKKIKVPKSLEIKFIGEALFNDGMGIVLFVVFLGVATGQAEQWTGWHLLKYFCQQALGGVAFGVLLGYFASKALKNVDNYEVAVLVTLAVVTGGYHVAHEVLEVSGVIAMSLAGLVIGSRCRKDKMPPQTVERLDSFWELIDDVLNAILFVLIGLECMSLSITLEKTIFAFIVIGIVLLARYLSVGLPVSVFGVFRKFSPGLVGIMTWGGLRGGIAIALALSIPHTPERDIIITITYAVVIFSIVVQGLTISPMLQRYSSNGNAQIQCKKVK